VPPLALQVSKLHGVPYAKPAESIVACPAGSACCFRDRAAVGTGSSTCSETSGSEVAIAADLGTPAQSVNSIQSPAISPPIVGALQPARKVTKVQPSAAKTRMLQLTTAYTPGKPVPGSICWRCQHQEIANRALEEKVRALEKAEEHARVQLQLLQQQQAASLEHINARLAAESENQRRITSKLCELQQHADVLDEIQCQQAGTSGGSSSSSAAPPVFTSTVLRSPGGMLGGGAVGPVGSIAPDMETPLTLGQLNASTPVPRQGAAMPRPSTTLSRAGGPNSPCSARGLAESSNPHVLLCHEKAHSVAAKPTPDVEAVAHQHQLWDAPQPGSLAERCNVPAALDKKPRATSQLTQQRSIAQWVADAACSAQLRICCGGFGHRPAPHSKNTKIHGCRRATITGMPKLGKR